MEIKVSKITKMVVDLPRDQMEANIKTYLDLIEETEDKPDDPLSVAWATALSLTLANNMVSQQEMVYTNVMSDPNSIVEYTFDGEKWDS